MFKSESNTIKSTELDFEVKGDVLYLDLSEGKVKRADLIATEEVIVNSRKGSKIYSIIDLKDHAKLSPDLKEYLISEERSWNIEAEAIVIKGFTKKLIVDLYFQLNLPLVPTKTFSNLPDAEKWIRNVRSKKNSAA